MTDLFAGKVALVTGAGSGIGRATAIGFARQGAQVIVSDIASGNGEAVALEIEALGGEAIFIDCDVSDREAVAALVTNAVARFGRLDCAVNNAGVFLEADTRWDDEAFDRTISINARGVMLCMKAEIAQMLKNGGGAIVNMASTHGLVAGSPSKPGYTASKHAVIGLTKDAAIANARQNIRVNAVCPGLTLTPMVENFAALGAEMRARLDNASPLGRICLPEEVAEAAVWLCSAKSSYVNGHALAVDGGATIQ